MKPVAVFICLLVVFHLGGARISAPNREFKTFLLPFAEELREAGVRHLVLTNHERTKDGYDLCGWASGRKITLYDVQDQRASGTIVPCLTHELTHVAYPETQNGRIHNIYNGERVGV